MFWLVRDDAHAFMSIHVVVAYLGIVEAAKRVFYAHFATTSKMSRRDSEMADPTMDRR